MATIRDAAYDYSMQRGHGKKDKAYENYYAGAKAVIEEIYAAYNLGGIEAMVDRINCYIAEIKE
jgi:hypothetical protein